MIFRMFWLVVIFGACVISLVDCMGFLNIILYVLGICRIRNVCGL